MAFWQNIPFFSILLCLASAAFTSIMPAKMAKRAALLVVGTVLCASAFLLFKMLAYGRSYTYMMGHFPAPWGNEIRVGVLEALMALAFSAIMLLSALGGMDRIEEQILAEKRHYYFVILELLMAALLAQVYTNDLFTAYVFVEIMTIAACSLITARTKGRTLVAATRYMIMNLLGSGLLLLGITLLYDLTGHLLMSNIQAQVALLAASGQYAQPLSVVIILLTIGLAIKSALFPFHTWLPDAYGYSTPASSAILSSLVSKGYIFLLIKIFYRVIGLDVMVGNRITNVLFFFALLGVILGSVSAIREKDIRRMISFSSVAQIGYVFMGIGLGTQAGMAAAVFHMLVHASAKSMLFLSASGLTRVSGESKLFRDLRGAGYRNRIAGIAFALGSFSMVGIPFLGGFISKLNFAASAMEMDPVRMAMVMIVLAASTVLNTIYFVKTVITIYRPTPDTLVPEKPWRASPSFLASMSAFVLINVLLGTCSQPIMEAIRLGLSMFA